MSISRFALDKIVHEIIKQKALVKKLNNDKRKDSEESLAYDEQTKKEIEKLYQTSDEYNKKDIFNAVSKNKSYESIKSKNSNKNQQPFTISL